MTRYVVFQQVEAQVQEGEDAAGETVNISAWERVNEVDASGTQQAIRAVVEEAELASGVFVAVPERSFRPEQITVTKQTRVVVGG